MLIIYRTASGEIVDNTGTNSRWPEGPPDDQAWVNVDNRGISRNGLKLLRLHDSHEDVAKVFDGRPVKVNPDTGRVVFTGEPAPTLPMPVDRDAEFRQAVEAAVAGEPSTSPIRKLADALLGTSGPGAEPRRNP